MVRSKSASNIISLKAVVKEKHGKRISFGETETRTMASRADQQDLRSRLGYGRQASPPPPEVHLLSHSSSPLILSPSLSPPRWRTVAA